MSWVVFTDDVITSATYVAKNSTFFFKNTKTDSEVYHKKKQGRENGYATHDDPRPPVA